MATVSVAFLCLGLLFSWLAPTRGSYDLDHLPNLYAAFAVGGSALLMGIFSALGVRRGKPPRAVMFIWGWLLLCCVLTVLRRNAAYVELLIGPLLGLGAALLVVLLADGLAAGPETQVVQADQMLIGTVALGGLMTAGTVFVQARVLPNLLGLVLMPPPDLAPVTNFAQPNLGSLLMAMGVVCVMGWPSSGGSGRATWPAMALRMLLVVPLVTAILLTQSRAGLVLSMTGLAAMLWLHRRPASWWQRLGVMVGVCTGVLMLCQWLAASIAHSDAALAHSTVQRFAEGEGLAMRLQIMAHGLRQWKEFPLLGGGWGTHAAWVFQHAEDIPWPRYTNHSHNLVSQLLGETGLLGVVPIAVVFLMLLKRVVSAKVWLQDWRLQIHSVLLLLMLLHSLVEYPLWNLFFLVPFSWTLTRLAQSACVADPAAEAMPVRPRRFVLAGAGMAVAVAAAALTMAMLDVVDERLMAQTLYTEHRHLPSPDPLGRTYFSDLIRYADPVSNSSAAADRRVLGERLVLATPIDWLIERLGIDQALSGDVQASATSFVRLCSMYRHRCTDVLSRLDDLSARVPVFSQVRQQVSVRLKEQKPYNYDLTVFQ